MPHRNTIRFYAPKNYYHIYNRGVEKRRIFLDHEDYSTFEKIIISYLTPEDDDNIGIPIRYTPYWRSKLQESEIEIISYCLMPNHFHFLLKQNTENGITKFMRRISNSYVRYFNKKYERVGSLFQGKFKAVIVETESYLLHLSRYIHLNPLEIAPKNTNQYIWLRKYPYSSYSYYLNPIKDSWVKSEIIMSHFKSVKNDYFSYQSFVENYKKPSEEILGNLTLD